MESCEYTIGQQMEEIEHLNSIIEEKTQYEGDKNAEFLESEASINKVKEQIVCFEQELGHLKIVEEKLVMENSDIQKRVNQEAGKSDDIERTMYELNSKIK